MKRILLFSILFLLFASAVTSKTSSSNMIIDHFHNRANDLTLPVAIRLAAYDSLLSIDGENTRLLLDKIKLLNSEFDFKTTIPLLDSLWLQHDKMTPSLRLYTLDEMIRGLSNSNDYSSTYFRSYEMLDMKKPDSLRYYEASALFNLSFVSNRVNDLFQAHKLLDRAIERTNEVEWPSQKEHDKMLARLYGQKGLYYLRERKLDEAYDYFNISLQTTDDSVYWGLNTANLGMVYYVMGKCDIAKDYFFQASRMRLPTPTKKVILLMLAESYRRMGKLENAKEIHKEMDSIVSNHNTDDNEFALIVGKGLIEGEQGNYQSAYNFMTKSYEMSESIKARQQKVLAENSKRQINLLEEARSAGHQKNLFIGISCLLSLIVISLGLWIFMLMRGRRRSQLVMERCNELERTVDLQRESLEKEAIKTADIRNIYTSIRDAMIEIRDTIDESMTPTQKIDKIKRIAKGHEVSERLLSANRQVREISDPVLLTALQRLYPNLTKGELEMCMFIRQGYSSKQIADITCRSRRTVDVVKHNLRQKMNIPVSCDISVFLSQIRDK